MTNMITLSASSNSGLQVGYNSGSIQFTAAPERPETPPEPSCLVPFRRDPDFVVRETLLDQIRQRCAAPASRVALVGLGGVGKSQLAIEYCYRTAEQSPETWIFWVHASNSARLQQGFQEIAEQVKARGRKDPQANPFKLVHDWLRNEKNGPWLLVLDNADDIAILSWPASNRGASVAKDDEFRTNSSSSDTPQQYLSRFLPPNRRGSVLVTSRTKHAAVQMVEDGDIIIVEPMDSLAASTLIYKKLGSEHKMDGEISELAAALDYIPLALVQAAAYIRERAPRYSVRQFLEECRKSNSKKTSLLNYRAGQLRRDEAASNSVLITWQISFEHIQKKRRSAADLLSLMSFFDRQGIHSTLLRNKYYTANQDMEDITANNGLEDDIVTLRDYSFITVTEDANIFEMHSLVQLAMRIWLESQGQLNQWKDQFITHLCAELPTGDYENWEKCQALFPHVRAALSQRPQTGESLKTWALLLYKAAWYANQKGIVAEAEEMATKSIDVRREVLGDEHPDTLASMSNLAGVLGRQGKYEEAESINRQTLAQNKKVLGLKHPSTLTSMNNLALVLDSQGKYEEAESMHRQALAQREKVLGPKHPHTLTSMNNLALVLYSQGKYEEAESIHRQTLVQSEKVLGPDHPSTLTSMSNLASVLDSQGKYEEAESIHRQTLAQSENILGPDHPSTLTSMNNLALVLGSQGKYEEAESMHRQTLAQRENILGPDHPSTLTSMNNLASVLDSQGKYEEAESMNRQTLAQSEKVLGPDHPSTLTSMRNLASVLDRQGKYEEAESMNRRILAQSEKVLGPNHPDTLASINNLAGVLGRQGKYEEAESMNRQTLAQNKKVLGLKHPSTLASMSNLASVLDRQGKYEEAESMHRQALAQREKVLGPKHPHTLTSAYCLAHHLASRYCYKESLALYKRACTGYQTVLGIDHPTTRACRKHYTKTQKHASIEQGSPSLWARNSEKGPSSRSTQSPDDIMSIRQSNKSRSPRRSARLRLRKAKRTT